MDDTLRPLPATAALAAPVGFGLRQPHYEQVLSQPPLAGFVEIHAENFFVAGGRSLHVLDRVRDHYELSVHGVGLALGSAEGLDGAHLAQLKALIDRVEPFLISEHLSWARSDGVHHNDLLPTPLTRDALSVFVEHVDQVQTLLRRRIAIENVSAYWRFAGAEMTEAEMLAALSARTGCAVLLDVNNLYVNALNSGDDPAAALRALPLESVVEIHLAGHRAAPVGLIDDHGSAVAAPVWALYRQALARFGPVATLVEWDCELPDLTTLLVEVDKAADVLRDTFALEAALPDVLIHV